MTGLSTQGANLRQQVLTGYTSPSTGGNRQLSIWQALAVEAVARRVGAKPTAATFTIPVAPESSRAVCSGAAGAALHAILNPDDALHLPEWCRLAAAAGCAPPPLLFPALLDWAGKDEERRQLVREISGSRESWLAAFRPEWRWLNAQEIDADALKMLWSEGKENERRDAFIGMRKLDAAQARQWLSEGWLDCSAELRTTCITAMSQGLSLDDEALLEQALDDRRKTVRDAAQAVLTLLSNSSYSKRAAIIAGRAFVVQRSGLLRRRKLETLQPKPDAAAARDGWDSGREWVAADFHRLLQRTPLSFWTGLCETTIEDAVEQIAELGPDFLLALLSAVQNHGTPDWLRAALAAVNREFLTAIGGQNLRAGQVPLTLIGRLPAAERSQAAERLLAAMSGPWWVHAVGHALPAPWTAAFTGRFVEQLRLSVDQPGLISALPAPLQMAVLSGDPATLQPLLNHAIDQMPAWATDESAQQRHRLAWQDALRLLDKRLAVRQPFLSSSYGNP